MNPSIIDAIANVLITYTKPGNIADLTKDLSQSDRVSAILGAAGLIEGVLSVANKSNPLIFASIGVITLTNDLRKIEISSTTNQNLNTVVSATNLVILTTMRHYEIYN